MINARVMYLRPGNLFKDFAVWVCEEKILDNGRPGSVYHPNGQYIKGCIAKSDPKDIEKFKSEGHPITHTIVQSGRPKCMPKSFLLLGERMFFVQGIDDTGTEGISTLYFVEERNDMK